MTAGPVVAQQESAAFVYGAAGPSDPTTPSGNAQVTTMASGTGTSPPEGTSQVDDIDEALLSPRTKPIDEPDAMDISTSAPLAASASVTAAAEPRNIAELQSAQVTSFNTTEQAAAPMDIDLGAPAAPPAPTAPSAPAASGEEKLKDANGDDEVTTI